MTFDPRDYFPDNLASALTERGFSSEDFAQLIDVTPATVVDWTEGRSFPCPRHYGRVCVVLGVDHEDLLCPF